MIDEVSYVSKEGCTAQSQYKNEDPPQVITEISTTFGRGNEERKESCIMETGNGERKKDLNK